MVCPSLPGYGFSGKPTRTGWSVEKIADAWATLMGRLGYDRYGAQGGDWGSAITTQIGRNTANGLRRIHLNMPLGFPTAESAQNPTPEEAAAMAAHRRPRALGHRLLRGSRPPGRRRSATG